MTHSASHHQKELFAIIDRARGGDTGAFQELYRVHVTPIFRFIYFRVKNRGDAEDLTQTVFVKAWNALPRFSTDRSGPTGGKIENPFSSFLYKIAQNAVIDYWKKKREVSLEEGIADAVLDDRADLEKRFENKDRLAHVRAAIAGLSDDQREIILLKFVNDLSNTEIATITGKTEEAIRAVQYRALKGLRGMLQRHISES